MVFETVKKIIEEMNRQVELWGEQTHSPQGWLPILVEEVGEVAKAVLESDEGYGRELIQVAAVATSAYIDFINRGGKI